MKITDIVGINDPFLKLLEVYDVGSTKDKDIGEIQIDQDGNVLSICKMCGGSGNMTHKHSLKIRPGATTKQRRSGTFGGECGTCHGKGVVTLYNIHEITGAKEATSVEQLKQSSPIMYQFLMKKAENSNKTKELLNNLDKGIPLSDKYVDLIITGINRENTHKDVIPTKKEDGRFRTNANKPAYWKR